MIAHLADLNAGIFHTTASNVYSLTGHVSYLLPLSAGLVTRDDMQIMLRQLAGSSLTDDDINCLVSRAIQEAASPEGLTFKVFRDTLSPKDLGNMVVEIPTEFST